jgi:hypothetical protein
MRAPSASPARSARSPSCRPPPPRADLRRARVPRRALDPRDPLLARCRAPPGPAHRAEVRPDRSRGVPRVALGAVRPHRRGRRAARHPRPADGQRAGPALGDARPPQHGQVPERAAVRPLHGSRRPPLRPRDRLLVGLERAQPPAVPRPAVGARQAVRAEDLPAAVPGRPQGPATLRQPARPGPVRGDRSQRKRPDHPAGRTRVTVYYRNHHQRKWRRVKRDRTDRRGYWRTYTRYKRGRSNLVRWRDLAGGRMAGAGTRVLRR